MKKTTLLTLFLALALSLFSQEEENTEWKPRVHITGYVNTVAEYTDLDNGFEDKKPAGIGLSEAAFLVSYKPLKKLEFKGTFVYTHFISDIQSLLVEAYGTYTISDKLKLSAGKYLTPLSMANQYFYAPLNPSATLPMVVSHHSMLPQSISGFQVSGEFGTDFKLGYNLTYGHYMSDAHVNLGILGIQGREDGAIVAWTEGLEGFYAQYYLGGTGRIYGSYNEIISVGLNYFDGRKASYSVNDVTTQSGYYSINATKYTTGIDVQLKLADLKINAEYWRAKLETTETEIETISMDMEAYYAEIIYEKGIFSPYFRYDYIDDLAASVYNPFPVELFTAKAKTTIYSAGLALRPIYEILLKAEYRNITTKKEYLNNITGVDNPLGITAEKYNHFIFSLVYSF